MISHLEECACASSGRSSNIHLPAHRIIIVSPKAHVRHLEFQISSDVIQEKGSSMAECHISVISIRFGARK